MRKYTTLTIVFVLLLSCYCYAQPTGRLGSDAIPTAEKAAPSGVASLNSSSKVVQDPANATATPTEAKIPITGASPGYLDAWITPFLKLQATTPGTQQTGHINVSGSLVSGALAALTTLAESWVGPSSAAGIYFKGGNIGIGTASPVTGLTVKCLDTALYSQLAVQTTGSTVGISLLNNAAARLGGLRVDGNSDLTLTNFLSGGDMYLTTTGAAANVLIPNGNIGIGTASPSQKLQVWGGNASVWDNTVLGAESLTDGTFTLEPGAGNWGVTAGWDATFANNKTNFNISGGAGNLTQAADKMVGAVSLVPNRWYKLTYTVSNSATSPAATITTAVASAATALTLTDGAQTTYFKSVAAPGTFTINATAGVFTLDGISLTELQGGSIALGAELKLGPTIIPPGATGNQTINKAAGRVNIAALGTSVTVTNNLVTANSTVVAVCATNDATAYVKNVVPGTGSFVVTLGAGATAETAVNWIVFN